MRLIDININVRMQYYNVTGLSVTLIDNAQISMAESYGLLEAGTNRNVNNHSIFNACSISKFLTGMLIMIVTEQGLLDLDEDVNNRLKSWKVPVNELTKNKKVTLRNLLSHQSGMIDPENSFSEHNSFHEIPSMADLLEGRTPYCNEPMEAKYEPESDFQYSDAGFCIIQQLIEDLTGKPFKEVMDERIFQPLNMNSSTFPAKKRADFSCGQIKMVQ